MKVFPKYGNVAMASTSSSSQIEGFCMVKLQMIGHDELRFHKGMEVVLG